MRLRGENMRKLTRSEWEQLDTQYSVTPALDDTFSATGEHYVLISLLNRLGFYPHSTKEAMSLTEELLARGYDD